MCRLSRLHAACAREGIARTPRPWTMDAWLVSPPLRARLQRLGVPPIILAGQSHDTVTIAGTKQDASPWKKARGRHEAPGGIEGSSGRVQAHRPTVGAIPRCCFQNSTTRSSDCMNVRQVSMRGAAIWHRWTPHPVSACSSAVSDNLRILGKIRQFGTIRIVVQTQSRQVRPPEYVKGRRGIKKIRSQQDSGLDLLLIQAAYSWLPTLDRAVNESERME